MPDLILESRGLGRTFGKLDVLSGLDFRVEAGEVLGVIGPNGAGKSTLLSLLGGSIAPTSGTISYRGEDITRRGAHWRARHGIATSYQVPRPFLGMTVLENVLVPARWASHHRLDLASERAIGALERTGLIERADDGASSLRLLDRKRLEVARALAADPSVMLLDEIAGGLTDQEVPELVTLVGELHQSGMTIVWIEHVVHALTQVASRLMCLTYGRVLADGTPSEVLNDPEVRQVYLGIEPDGSDIEADFGGDV